MTVDVAARTAIGTIVVPGHALGAAMQRADEVGWPDPQSDVSGCVEAWWAAEDGTNRAMARAFDCLSPAEAGELVDAVDAAVEQTGMPWYLDEGSPTIQFGSRPG